MTIPKLALTFEEATEACGYSVRTLRDQVVKGNLLARYANSKGVIRVEDLAQWLDELPVEPKAGHRPVSSLDDGEKGVHTADTPGRTKDVISSDLLGDDLSTTEPVTKPCYRKPEDVAPELGMTKTELRNYCRISGIHTRLSKNRIMLAEEDINRLLAWIKEHRTNSVAWNELECDPFV